MTSRLKLFDIKMHELPISTFLSNDTVYILEPFKRCPMCQDKFQWLFRYTIYVNISNSQIICNVQRVNIKIKFSIKIHIDWQNKLKKL